MNSVNAIRKNVDVRPDFDYIIYTPSESKEMTKEEREALDKQLKDYIDAYLKAYPIVEDGYVEF